MKFYNLEDIKKHLEQLKAEHRAKVEAWQNVTIEKKKNSYKQHRYYTVREKLPVTTMQKA